MTSLRVRSLLAAFLLPATLAAQTPEPAGPTVRGIVRSRNAAQPLVGALVELPGTPRRTLTNLRGEYHLQIPFGTHEVVISRRGYATRSLAVIAGADSVVDIDVTLDALPTILGEIVVRANRRGLPENGETAPFTPLRPGERQLHFRGNPAVIGDDVLAALATTPDGVGSGPDRAAALQIRGGASDQNLVFLDGVPSYEARHMFGTTSAFNPDVIGDALLHAGVPSARLGNALSSVIELHTREINPTQWTTSGGIAHGLARVMMTAPVGGRGDAFMLSGRRSIRGVPGFASGGSNTAVAADDFMAKMTFPLYGGHLEALSFTMSDDVAFAAAAVTDQAATREAAGATSLQNRLGRGSQTLALVWQGPESSMVHTGARLWRSYSETFANWRASAGPVRMDHGLRSVGIGADAAWRIRNVRMSGGVQIERLRTRYHVAGDSAGSVVAGGSLLRRLSLGVERTLPSSFVEAYWALDPRWALSLGARGQLGDGGRTVLEPRLALEFRPRGWLSLAASAGRIHQPLQSLSNGESIFDSLLGGGLMAVTEGAMAQSDRVAFAATVSLSRRGTLSFETYASRFSALTIPAPTSARPFAIDSVVRLGGTASGILIGFNYGTARLTAQAAYALSTTVRHADGLRYVPGNGDAHALSAALGYRLGRNSSVHAAVWAAAGRRTTLASGDLEWASAPLTQSEDLAGTQLRWLGALGAEPLPNYLRVDVGVRHSWQLRAGPRTFTVTGSANIVNALDRADARGVLVPAAGNARRYIRTAPRMLLLGVEWSY